jgi:hypothetical protein
MVLKSLSRKMTLGLRIKLLPFSMESLHFCFSDSISAAWKKQVSFSIVSGSGVGTLYMNGVAQSSATTSGTGGLSLQDTSGPMTRLTIGCQGAVTGAFAYTGYIDDVRIYTSALTASFILSIYNFNGE